VPRRYLTSEEFIQKINKNIRRYTVVGIVLLIYLISVLYLISLISSFVIASILWIVYTVSIITILAFIPSKIYITESSDLIVCGLILRRVSYGKVLTLLEAGAVPDLVCYSGNRGFFGYWALCSSDGNTFILISKRKCEKLYEITTSSHRIYLCTEKEMGTHV